MKEETGTGKIPKSWEPTEIDKRSGWKFNSETLSELVTALNEEEYIEDESVFMETMDNILLVLSLRYDITEKTTNQ